MGISLFTGCSYTAGTGFTLEKDEPGLWVNLLHSENKFIQQTQLINAGVPGRSNANIFADTLSYLLTNDDIEYVFVSWTSWPRYEIMLGLELYSTRQLIAPNSHAIQQKLNDITYTSSYLNNIRDRFVTLDHPHNEILNLVKYTSMLAMLSQLKNVKIYFINGLCWWDLNYFNKIIPVTPTDLTEYTKKIISIDTRDDDEIFKIYNKIHNEYQNAGTINDTHWLNLYQPLWQLKVDVNNDKIHPGLKSNKIFADLLNSSLNLKLNQQ